MRFSFPWRDEELWITPGGAIEPGETVENALIREIWEETGLRIAAADIDAELWQRQHEFTLGDEHVLQKERYYLIKTNHFEPIASALDAGNESDWFRELKWWEVSRIPDLGSTFAPRSLGLLLRKLIADGAPESPISLEI